MLSLLLWIMMTEIKIPPTPRSTLRGITDYSMFDMMGDKPGRLKCTETSWCNMRISSYASPSDCFSTSVFSGPRSPITCGHSLCILFCIWKRGVRKPFFSPGNVFVVITSGLHKLLLNQSTPFVSIFLQSWEWVTTFSWFAVGKWNMWKIRWSASSLSSIPPHSRTYTIPHKIPHLLLQVQCGVLVCQRHRGRRDSEVSRRIRYRYGCPQVRTYCFSYSRNNPNTCC